MKGNRSIALRFINRILVAIFAVLFALLNSGVNLAQARTPEQADRPGFARPDRESRLSELANLVDAAGKTDALRATSNLAKLDSHLQDLLAVRMRGQDVVGAAARSNLHLQNGADVLIDIYVNGSKDEAERQLSALGMRVQATNDAFGGIVEGYLPLDSVLAAAGLNTTKAFLPVTAYGVDTGSVTSQGDGAHNGPAARALGATGAGVVVGIISDSMNQAGTGVAGSQGLGDLPATVTVLADDTSGSDEGRAMAEIIYDTAPGITTMKFSTGTTGAVSKAGSIYNLTTSGVDIIADDIYYLEEPFFQDGVIAQTVDYANSQGVAYFASAGNRARQSYEQTYRDTGDSFHAHNFTPSGYNWLQTIATIPNGSCWWGVLQWDDPWNHATHDFDWYLYNTASQTIIDSSESSNVSTGLPIEELSWCNSTGSSVTIGDEIDWWHNSAAPSNQRLKFISSSSIAQFDTASDTINPDAASARGAMAVAAVAYNESGLNDPESYSSRGPKMRVFNSAGVRLGSPEIRQKPQIAGADCVSTSNTFDTPGGFGGGAFCGTSAATPSVAGVAALALSMQPTLTPAALYALLGNSNRTNDCTLAGNPDADCGYGFLLADRAVSAATPHAAGKYDDANLGWTYGGIWVGLSTPGTYGDTLRLGFAQGATASFTIQTNPGGRFALSYLSYTGWGKIGVYLDGSATPLTTINTSGAAGFATYTSPPLPAGIHTVMFKHAGPAGSYIAFDSLEVISPTYQGSGTYDDSDAAWSYEGAWGAPGIPGAYNNTLHIAVSPGSTGSFFFTGSSFSMTYLTYTGWGTIGVYLDGSTTPLASLNTNTSAGLPSYNSGPLTAGNHWVVFKHNGPAGSMIAIDKITIP